MWGTAGEGFEGGGDQFFSLRKKKIAISLKKARLTCYVKGAWAVICTAKS